MAVEHKLMLVNYGPGTVPDQRGEHRDVELPANVLHDLNEGGWQPIAMSTDHVGTRHLVTILCRRDTTD